MLVLHVRGRTLADLTPAGLLATDTPIALEEAMGSSFRGLAAREETGGVSILSGAPEYLALADRLVTATGAEVVALLDDSVASTYGWFVFAPDGTRQLVSQEGSIVADEGRPVPEEDGLEIGDQGVWELFERRTGVPLPWPDDATATLLAPG